MTNKIVLTILVIGVWSLVIPVRTFAFSAQVVVDTGKETINALEGTLVLPEGVSAPEIQTGNSVILFWVSPPKLNGNTISFAGITPGGFRGQYPIFSLDVSSIAGLSFSNVKAYKSDGSGESVSVRLSLRKAEITEDDAPPEPFTPVISSSPDIFDGGHFVSFVAQDKGTGVNYYESASTWFWEPKEWISTESPKLLSSLERFKSIHIRAVDHAGNVRAVSTAGPYRYYLLMFGVIILLCVLSFLRRSFHPRLSSPY